MSKADNKLLEAFSKAGLRIDYVDGEVIITPTVLRGTHIEVTTRERGMYIADPATVPPELKDKNILWVSDPIQVEMYTEDGYAIPILVEEVNVNHERIEPSA